MTMEHKPYGLYEKYIKRILDICCGLIVFFLFWWLYLIIALLVKVKLGSPVLFIQERPGKNEKVFKLYKFRTMTDERDEKGKLLPDEQRLNSFGKWLRSTSLDELPEVYNLLNGTMSLCGPRPLLIKYLPYYSEAERMRHLVRPGLTGLAQVSGRNNLEWDKRLELDITYVQEISFVKDMKILLLTIFKVISKKDIASGDEMSMRDLDDERRD